MATTLNFPSLQVADPAEPNGHLRPCLRPTHAVRKNQRSLTQDFAASTMRSPFLREQQVAKESEAAKLDSSNTAAAVTTRKCVERRPTAKSPGAFLPNCTALEKKTTPPTT